MVAGTVNSCAADSSLRSRIILISLVAPCRIMGAELRMVLMVPGFMIDFLATSACRGRLVCPHKIHYHGDAV